MSQHPSGKKKISMSEDWLSVLLAFFFFFLSVLGILGETGIQIKF